MAETRICNDPKGQPPIFSEGNGAEIIFTFSIKSSNLKAHYGINKSEDLYKSLTSLDSLKEQLYKDYEEVKAELLEGIQPVDYEEMYEFYCGTTRILCFHSDDSTGFFATTSQRARSRIKNETTSQRARSRIKNENIRVEVVKDNVAPIDFALEKKAEPLSFDIPSFMPLTDRPTVTVAVIDSGIDYSHEHLRGLDWIPTSAWTNYNCSYPYNYGVDFTRKNNPKDETGHGTHVAGIISGNAESAARNGEKIDYPSKEIDLKLMNLKVGVDDYTLCDLVCAVNYAIENNADIINLSLGYYVKKKDEEGNEYNFEFDPLFRAIKRATRRGILVVTSAGNAGADLSDAEIDYFHIPSGYCKVLPNLLFSVGSTKGGQDAGILASHSNFGEEYVNITAPGNCLLSSSIEQQWSILSGTSLAAAQISRIASRILGQSRSVGESISLLELMDRVVEESKALNVAEVDKVARGIYVDA